MKLPPLFKKDGLHISDTTKTSKQINHTELNLKKTGNMSLIELNKIRRSYKLKSNVISVVKRYATYHFTSTNLDK